MESIGNASLRGLAVAAANPHQRKDVEKRCEEVVRVFMCRQNLTR